MIRLDIVYDRVLYTKFNINYKIIIIKILLHLYTTPKYIIILI
jgi:hypothetical protein